MTAARIRFYKPTEPLQPYLSAYYFMDLDGGDPVDDLMHPEWGNIRFTLSGYWTFTSARSALDSRQSGARLYGPTSHTTQVHGEPPTRTAGVGILPLGWAHLIGAPADHYADRIVPLTEIFDAAPILLQRLREATDDRALCSVFDMFFLRLHRERPEPAAILRQAHALLLDPSVGTAEEFAAGLGLSSRHVARLSLEMFGFAPKLLLRRQRFLRTLHVLRTRLDEPWAKLLDAAYSDQSHFVRDFHRFMGMSPTAYFKRPHPVLDPAALLRMREIGESLQGLHPVASPEE